MAEAHIRVALRFAIFVVCCSCAFALDPSLDISQYAHTTWKIRDGFTKGAVGSIVQTPDGYLWLGTEFGLLRFDGVRAVPWQPRRNQHLPSGTIRSLLVSRDGTLWIGAKGLASWSNGKLTEYSEFADLFVYTLLEDHEGTIWVASGGVPVGKLCAIHKDSIHCYGDDGSLGRFVNGLYEDDKRNLWAGVKNGLWRWKPSPPKYYSLPGNPDALEAFAEDPNGALLVGWKGGIYRFADGTTEAYSLLGNLPQFQTRKILRDRDGGLWIGTFDRGVVHVHQGITSVLSQADGLSGDDVLTIFEDREGNIWVSTAEGLDRFRDYAVATLTVKQGLSGAVVGSVLADKDGSVWIATYGGLNRWNHGQITIPPTGSAKRDGKLNGSDPSSLFQDDRGRIWVSTNRDLGYLENGRFTRLPGVPGGQMLSMAQDTGGNLWVINEPVGLFRISPQNEVRRISWIELGHKDHASVLAADPRHGGLWIGFFLGGIAYFSNGQVRASYTTTDGLGSGRVSDFQLDDDGTLWVSTAGGLSRLKDNRVVTLTSKNGLPCDAVHWTIPEDDHSMWLYMACGLARIDRSQLDVSWAASMDNSQDKSLPVRVTVFDSSDGVRSLSEPGHFHPQVAKTPDGKLWFVPWPGVSVIDPSHTPFNKVPPPVHIEQVVADQKTYDTASQSGSLHLPSNVRDLEIDYTALSLVAPEKIRFRYKLEGRDDDWQDAGIRRQAFYTNLPPRPYRFRVAACNNSGVWNEAGAFLDFSIAPAYYQTNWFRALCVAAFLALLWALYRLRVQQLRNEERKFREAVEAMPALAFVSLPDGSRTFVNNGWVEYTGLTVEQAAGSGWQAATHPEDLNRVLSKWQASLASGDPLEYETRLRRGGDGEYRWFLTRSVPIRDKRGKIVKWCGTATDIEDRKRAEELQAELAHINRVTTMGELTASLAHEIKQPIGAAVTNAEVCLRLLNRNQPDVPDAREAALEMVKDARRAGDIIDRVRSLYQKAGSKQELVDVNEIIAEMLILLRNEANRHSVNMRTNLAEGLPQVTTDRVQLQQVLMNLMLNGIEAMRDNGGELSIQSQLGESGQLLISITDNGVGLPPERADQIFNAFFTTKPQGTGLGLSITRSIVESHGGRVWATANSGRGTTFHFTLPIRTAVSA
jgi:PAS domain S-box-containing protein